MIAFVIIGTKEESTPDEITPQQPSLTLTIRGPSSLGVCGLVYSETCYKYLDNQKTNTSLTEEFNKNLM
jgi:hypothetical protein